MPAIIVNNKGSDLNNDYVLKGLSGGKAITIIVKTKFNKRLYANNLRTGTVPDVAAFEKLELLIDIFL